MYQTVLFDVDGVMLSEERYFDASALTVYELLFSPQYLGLQPSAAAGRHGALPAFSVDLPEQAVHLVRRAVFDDDHVLHAIKRCGVNANWDMVYLQTAMQLARVVRGLAQAVGTQEAAAMVRSAARDGWSREALRRVGEAVNGVPAQDAGGWIDFASFVPETAGCRDKADLFQRMNAALQAALDGADVTPFSAGRVLWTVCQETFQEWYVGDAHVASPHQPGKRGFLTDEIPLVDPPAFSRMLDELKRRGIQLGIATGRPALETTVPLQALGWLSAFDAQRITTASDVLHAERAVPSAAPLSKPNPFSYLRSYLRTTDVEGVLGQPLPLPAQAGKQVLVVGDSIADLLAARAAGFDFAAVLTGLEGQGAREAFVSRGADHIFDGVLDVATLFAG
ncbi:HAD family hydrolase [Alicyclobacillus cycloheptanicus]|uniref:Phosphoglycolate phosphatase-like HAD superfamily hydrolase n=1 Tax=Alicyclobacillus cycloheptanicus TaxID=1457 RepID=A0ABT9XGW0_9BACL|nr:HAD family hydrolase [Alicyclobacillus cycloheptanicus]MDQ0189546.1 phosphoglycolate phosphatase-like HAD superfamily hydrolase [Alicyclobacillus cycloheptanicus]WDM01601.1 HAD family hydrolase [Alicyclobacillus cycloheptanicus]